MSPTEKARKAVEDYVREYMPKDLLDLRRGASWSLSHGPFSVEEMEAEGIENWPGYFKACRKLEEWGSEWLHDFYWDADSETLMESAPEPWEDEETGEMIEPDLSCVWHLSRGDVYRMAFGALIGNGMEVR